MRNVIILDRDTVSKLGINKAIVYSELLEESRVNRVNKGETADNYFPMPVERLQELTSLSDYRQRKVIKELVEEGVIACELKGIPQIRYFRILKFDI